MTLCCKLGQVESTLSVIPSITVGFLCTHLCMTQQQFKRLFYLLALPPLGKSLTIGSSVHLSLSCLIFSAFDRGKVCVGGCNTVFLLQADLDDF